MADQRETALPAQQTETAAVSKMSTSRGVHEAQQFLRGLHQGDNHQSLSREAPRPPSALTAAFSDSDDNMSSNSNHASAADASTILTVPANSESSMAEEDIEERGQRAPLSSSPSSSVSEHVMSSDEEMDEDNQSTAPSHSSNSDSTRSEQNSWFDYFTRAPGSQEPLLVGPSDWDDIYHGIRRRYKIPDSEPDCRQTLARMGHDSILIRLELPRQGHST
ncbi:hypothetical protein BJX62DRAFT_232937 [Aspergillus germanicus]